MDFSFLSKQIDIEALINRFVNGNVFLGNARWILLIVPALCIIVAAWILGKLPDRSAVSKVLTFIAEPNLSDLMKKNGFSKMSVAYFQSLRLVVSALIGAGIAYVFEFSKAKGLVLGIIVLIGMYKFFYAYLLYRDKARIKRLNIVLPYTIKSIAYLANVYPVNNALLKAIDLVPKEFTEDLTQLCRDIDEDPVSFAPYQKFIDRYEGRLNRLDYYLKTLYRMSMSASHEETKLLSNLNETISEEMSNARTMKNDSINKTVQYLGLIPVALLSFMLMFLMVVITTEL